MKKLIVIVILIGVNLSLQAYDIHQNDVGRQQGSQSGYEGKSGQQYQYDMSNGNDRNSYSVDTDAQQRDYRNSMYDTSGNVQQDQQSGQYGSGIYGN